MPLTKANRTSFKPGQSGNPKGRPKKVLDLLEQARGSVPKALEYANKLLDDEEADAKLRLDAAKFLTSYGIGAPPKSTVTIDEDDDVQTSAPPSLELIKTGLAQVRQLRKEQREEAEPDDAEP